VVLVNEVDLGPIAAADDELGYDIVVVPEVLDGRTIYVARHPELLSVLAQGDTVEDALRDLRDVLAEFLADMSESGVAVPPPHAAPRQETLAVMGDDPRAETTPFDIEWTIVKGT